MKKVIALYLLCCCAIISVSGAKNVALNDESSNSTSTVIKATSPASKAETTDGSSTTVRSTFSETSTPAAVTSTPAAVTSTPAAVTSTSATVTSAAASVTSTTATVTSTTASKVIEPVKEKTIISKVSSPTVDLKSYKWIANGTNSSIIVQMAVELIVVYQNSTSKKNVSLVINGPVNNGTKVEGNFTPSDETLKLSWNSTGVQNNSILFHFTRFMNTYLLNNLEISLSLKDIPNESNSSLIFVHNYKHFNTSIGNSYRCIRLQTFNLTKENDTTITGIMKVSDLQFEAFKADNKTSFGYAEDCAFDTPDIVPIAVGCVLAGLVIIVLAAYLISRRFTNPRGYRSM